MNQREYSVYFRDTELPMSGSLFFTSLDNVDDALRVANAVRHWFCVPTWIATLENRATIASDSDRFRTLSRDLPGD